MKYTLLIVEKNQFMIDKMEAGIKGMGLKAKVLIAKSFDEASEILSQIPVDLFLVDILLGGELEVGYSFIKELQAGFPHSPVIVVSGNLDAQQQVDIFNELYIFSYISKPFQNFDVINKIKKALPLADLLNNRFVTFRRNNFSKTYRTKDIYCIQRLPNGKKKIAVMARDELSGEILTEEFPIKSSLNEVLGYFDNERDILRCHQTWCINPNFIRGFDVAEDEVILIEDIRIPVGDTYKESLEKFI